VAVTGEFVVGEHLPAGAGRPPAEELPVINQDVIRIGRDLVGVGPHLVEPGRLNEERPRRLGHRDVEHRGQPAHGTVEVSGEIVVVDEHDVPPVATGPGVAHVVEHAGQ
jgi:hypothetical protein